MSRPKILLVEDCEFLGHLWVTQLSEEGVEVIWAQSLETADEIFKEDMNFGLIVMNCCVPGCTPNSMWLVEKIRQSGYKRPIIARSGAPSFCEALIKAGASHKAVGEDLVPLIKRLIYPN